MEHIPVRVRLPAGLFSLTPQEEGRLHWEGPGTPSQPEAGPVLAWECCLSSHGDFHLILCTATRHLIHCVTADGQRWSRRGLSCLEREDITLVGLAIAAAPDPAVIYLLSGEGSAPVAVLYRGDARGGWHGQRLPLPPAGALRQIALSADAQRLYGLFRDRTRSRLFRISLESGAAWEILSLPAHPEALRLLEMPDGALHTLYLAEGQPWGDGVPLEPAGGCTDPCLYRQGEQVFCAYRRAGRWATFRYAPEGWQRQESAIGPGEPFLLLEPGLRQRMPPPSETPAPASAPAPTPEQLLRNQALLLTELRQELTGLRRDFFTLDARVRALEARKKAPVPSEGIEKAAPRSRDAAPDPAISDTPAL